VWHRRLYGFHLSSFGQNRRSGNSAFQCMHRGNATSPRSHWCSNDNRLQHTHATTPCSSEASRLSNPARLEMPGTLTPRHFVNLADFKGDLPLSAAGNICPCDRPLPLRTLFSEDRDKVNTQWLASSAEAAACTPKASAAEHAAWPAQHFSASPVRDDFARLCPPPPLL